MIKTRLHFLDSIRGIAAFCVLLSHTFACFLFAPSPLLQTISRHIFIFDGQFAVRIFFVLSGMSLSIAYLSAPLKNETKNCFEAKECVHELAFRQLKRMIAQRYFRLALPIAMTSTLIMIMINMGCMVNNKIDNQFSNDWINLFFHLNHVSTDYFLKFSFYDSIFTHGTDKYWLGNSINPVLWTMPIEFMGSMLVLICILLLKDDKRKWMGYWILAVFFYMCNSFMFHFILGIFISELYVKYQHIYLSFDNKVNYMSIAIIILLLIFTSLTSPRSIGITGLISFLIILLCSTNKLVITFLEKPIFLFLAKICFTLYLVHLPIITSLTSFLVKKFDPIFPLHITILLSGTITIIVSIFTAYILAFGEKTLILFYKKVIS